MLDSLLEKTLLGYTRVGYRARALSPVEERMDGRRVVITGASSGLGAETARQLARLGAEVTLVGRNHEKTTAVAGAIRSETAGAALDVEVADLSLVADTRALASRLVADSRPVHVLINNAGVLLPERELSGEGIEKTLATNLLSHHVLTEALLDKLRASAPSRIINVSSGGMYTQRIKVDDLEMRSEPYRGAVAYARTKRGQVILTERWARKLAGTGVSVHAMHPGWADTPGVKRSLPTFRRITRAVLRDDAEGADTIVWLAAAAEAGDCTAGFWHDRRRWPLHRSRSTRETPIEREALVAELERLAGGA